MIDKHQIEKFQNAISEQEAELNKIKAENEPKIKDLQGKIDAIDSTIEKITQERNEVIPKIGKHIFRQYDLIVSRRKTGRAISQISTNRTCSICYKVLEPQFYNEIRRGNKLLLCQSCGSIMIWQPEQSNDSDT